MTPSQPSLAGTFVPALRRASIAALVLASAVACSRGGGKDRTEPPSEPSPEPAAMAVTPDDTFETSGFEGGPFAPGSFQYTVENTGEEALAWSVDGSEPWVSVTPTSGTLDEGEQAIVTVTIEDTANALRPGLATASVDFVNETNGAGTTSRGIVLEALKIEGLSMLPAEPFTVNGPKGGPFAPTEKVYTLKNTDANPLSWATQAGVLSITTEPASGTLQPNEEVAITVKVDEAAAGGLGLGTYSSHVVIYDVTNDRSARRPVSINVGIAPGGTAQADRLTQFGITWIFDQEYTVGQYANGDWWVLGPVKVIDILPRSANVGGRVGNGSMVNPSPRDGMKQGYDSAMYAQYKSPGDYLPLLNVATNLSASRPLTLPTDTSLVSSRSEILPNVRPQISTAAILTVVSSQPPARAFRPPYCGGDKTSYFTEDDLDYTRLARLKKVPATPSLPSIEAEVRRVWLDHVPIWIGRYLHPAENMPDYGREIADMIGTATLLLNCDFSDVQKRDLLVNMAQLGIDFYGIVQDGGRRNWPPSAGHMSGRKWAILFAGIVLNDPVMGSVGFDKQIWFGEDGQTFYVQETSPGVYNNGHGGYSASMVGLPDWGTAHTLRPELDDARWFGDPYRHCCTANAWWGEVLSAYVMGAKDLWNHDALFDYMDRYKDENTKRGILDWRMAWSRFPWEMWEAYREDY